MAALVGVHARIQLVYCCASALCITHEQQDSSSVNVAEGADQAAHGFVHHIQNAHQVTDQVRL
jgi:hypothetical protein